MVPLLNSTAPPKDLPDTGNSPVAIAIPNQRRSAIRACQELSERFGLHAFESGYSGRTLRELLAPSRG